MTMLHSLTSSLRRVGFRVDSVLRRTVVAASVLIVTVPALTGAAANAEDGAASANMQIPQYELDTSWPKLPLPNNWALGRVTGIFVDTKNHLWMLQDVAMFPNAVGGELASVVTKCCVPAPAVIEFDQQGNVVRSWGGPGAGYDWPSFPHGVYVDYKGNVWIAGAQTRTGQNGSPPDGMVLKFSADGKFLLQIGGRGPSKGSLDTTQLGGPSAVAVDPQSNEVFIADGYGNSRVIVFDADSGAFKRQWGAYGEPPTDDQIGRYDPSAPPARQFRLVHCVRISNDGLVYVCDRLNDRLQIFKKDGTFVREHYYETATRGSGSVGNVSFWPDADQSLLLMNDPGNVQWVLTRRASGEVLSRFGHFGMFAGQFHRTHQMEFDLNGAIYVSEDFRVQRFKIVNGVKPAASGSR